MKLDGPILQRRCCPMFIIIPSHSYDKGAICFTALSLIYSKWLPQTTFATKTHPKHLLLFILDAPVIIQQRNPIGCDTIGDYVDKIIWPELLDLFERYDRIEWVSDIWSKKSALRDSRGAGRTRIVDANTKISKDWREFMNDEDNKTQLFPVIGTLIIDKPIPIQI